MGEKAARDSVNRKAILSHFVMGNTCFVLCFLLGHRNVHISFYDVTQRTRQNHSLIFLIHERIRGR
jgi:hypothetical protein